MKTKKVGEKRRSREACNAGDKGTGQGLRGEGGGGAGGEKIEKKRKKETTEHKQGSFQRKGKEEAVEMRKHPLSEEAKEAQEQQHEEGVDGSRSIGEAAKKKRKVPAQPPKKPVSAM
jgi:hypothetical protein